MEMESGYSCTIDTAPSIQDNRQFDTIDDNGNDRETNYSRGTNYCRNNGNGEVDQQGGVEMAIARCILDFQSTCLNKDIVFGDVTIPAGTSFRLGHSDEMRECLRLAIVAWTITYNVRGKYSDLPSPSATGNASLDKLIVGASIYYSMDISVYYVERNACFALCCPTNTASSLVLTRYDNKNGTSCFDLTFSPPYVDYNQVLWDEDTNAFPQNNNDRNQLLLERVFSVIRDSLDSFSYKDHIYGVTRLVPFHLIDTVEGRARILGRFLPAVLNWLFLLVENDTHPSETPLDWVMAMVRSYNDEVQNGVLDPNGAGGYARMSCMTTKQRMDRHELILTQTPPRLPGGEQAFGKMVDFIKEWTNAYGGIPKAFDNPSLVCYIGESINISRRLEQENDPNNVDGAKLNWISTKMGLKFHEIMFAHVPPGIARKFECLMLEGLMLTALVGVAHLIGDTDYKGLASSGDGLNEMNGGRAWINDARGDSMERIISWLRAYASEYPAELAMSSVLVPEAIRRFADSQRSAISRFWLQWPPEKINIYMLHKYICSLGGRSVSNRTNDSDYRIYASKDSGNSKEWMEPVKLTPEKMLERMRPVPSEKFDGRSEYGNKLCRTEVFDGDKWVPCQKHSASKCEGHCILHYNTYASKDSGNSKEWKEPVKLTPEEMLKRMKAVPREKVVGRKNRQRLCRTVEFDGEKWVPCNKSYGKKCQGHCMRHYNIYASQDPGNSKEWKE